MIRTEIARHQSKDLRLWFASRLERQCPKIDVFRNKIEILRSEVSRHDVSACHLAQATITALDDAVHDTNTSEHRRMSNVPIYLPYSLTVPAKQQSIVVETG